VRQFGCDNLNGTAKLCTASGQIYTFQLTGQVKAWLNTNGSKTALDITSAPARPCKPGPAGHERERHASSGAAASHI